MEAIAGSQFPKKINKIILESDFFKFKTGEFYNFSKQGEKKLKFPYRKPSCEFPPSSGLLKENEIEDHYKATLEGAKAYQIENTEEKQDLKKQNLEEKKEDHFDLLSEIINQNPTQL